MDGSNSNNKSTQSKSPNLELAKAPEQGLVQTVTQKIQAMVGTKDEGAPHNLYFARMNELLKNSGPGCPRLVIDLDRVDKNIATANRFFTESKRPRIVVKSLPSPNLVEYMMKGMNTNRLMVFHLPFLQQVVERFPEADLLLGKPMPIQAVRNFYGQLSDKSSFKPAEQLQWLIDTEERLLQYLGLAQENQLKLRVNIEIDVGLHRGGIQNPIELASLLEAIQNNPEHLEFSGFMGYDPHVSKAPSPLSSIDRAFKDSTKAYQTFIDFLASRFPNLYHTDLTFNGAGSPTYQLHERGTPLNDLSLGSCLVKPTDFDVGTIQNHVDAVFIATPVLKKLSGISIPFIEWANQPLQKVNPNMAQSFFIYGGYWMAKPVSPNGLRKNPLYGNSSNQEILNGSAATGLEVDDYVFLRPTQSEAVFLQFGDLLMIRANEIIDRWPVFRQ